MSPLDESTGTLEMVAGWGRFPVRQGRVLRPQRLGVPEGPGRILPRGLGRAYGDAAVPAAPDDLVIDTTRADNIVDFDPATGRVTCEAGLSLAEVLRVFLPRGWFLPSPPGTQHVTIGGWSRATCTARSSPRRLVRRTRARVDARDVATARSGVRSRGEPELFQATVGGMGLTATITEVEFRLRPCRERVDLGSRRRRSADIDSMLRARREAAAEWPYTVGVDRLFGARQRARPRLLICGRQATRDEAAGRGDPRRPILSVPFSVPGWVLSPPLRRVAIRSTTGARERTAGSTPVRDVLLPARRAHRLEQALRPARLPPVSVRLPRAAGERPAAEILRSLPAAGAVSFLAVIKDCGPEGRDYLRFPRRDLLRSRPPVRRSRPGRRRRAERDGGAEGGRMYLAKDAFTRAEHFRAMGPASTRFIAFATLGSQRRLSAQSVRLLGDPLDR